LRRRSGGLLPSITLHAMNNALAMMLTFAFSSTTTTTNTRPAQAARPVAMSPELAACMRAAHGRDAVPPEALSQATGLRAAELLNAAAWTMALDPATSPACLRSAEAAVNGALRRAPEQGNLLDTKATIYYREGRIDEAVDLERAAIARSNRQPFYSQLDRFLRARRANGTPAVDGASAAGAAQIALEPASGAQPAAISFQLSDQLLDSVELYAVAISGKQRLGVLRVRVGPGHSTLYREDLESSVLRLPGDTRFEVTLVDSRGCEGCVRGQWRLELLPYDATVDGYPR
jgi:hypothetical protein